MLYGQTLWLPRDFHAETRLPRISFPDDTILQMRKFAQSCTTVSAREVQRTKPYLRKDIQTCLHLFLRHDTIKPNLTPTYDGPFKVISRNGKIFTIENNSKTIKVGIDRVKPAHLFCHVNANDKRASLPSPDVSFESNSNTPSFFRWQ